MSDDEEEFTEEVVEGIYVEHLHRIETIPGYAEASERALEAMRRLIDDDKPIDPTDTDHPFSKAIWELYLLSLGLRLP